MGGILVANVLHGLLRRVVLRAAAEEPPGAVHLREDLFRPVGGVGDGLGLRVGGIPQLLVHPQAEVRRRFAAVNRLLGRAHLLIEAVQRLRAQLVQLALAFGNGEGRAVKKPLRRFVDVVCGNGHGTVRGDVLEFPVDSQGQGQVQRL